MVGVQRSVWCAARCIRALCICVYVYECVCGPRRYHRPHSLRRNPSPSRAGLIPPSGIFHLSCSRSLTHARRTIPSSRVISLSDMCTHAARPMILSPSLVSFLFLPRVNISPPPLLLLLSNRYTLSLVVPLPLSSLLSTRLPSLFPPGAHGNLAACT